MFRTSGDQIGSVSRMQLLTSNLVDRLHDAVYVLPRHPSQNLNLDEYAVDIAYSLQELTSESAKLPTRRTPEDLQARLRELKEEDDRLSVDLQQRIETSRELLSLLDKEIGYF